MTRKKETKSKKLKQLFQFAERQKPQPSYLRQFIGNDVPTGGSLDNPSIWDLSARTALRLDSDDFIATALRRAFDYFKLDPIDPTNWRVLLSQFAYVYFGERPRAKPGAKRKWSQDELAALNEMAANIRAQQPKNKRMLSDESVARIIARDKKSPYYSRKPEANAGVPGLRKALGVARRRQKGRKTSAAIAI